MIKIIHISLLFFSMLTVSFGQQSVSPCFELMKQGERLVGENRFNEAIVVYQKFLRDCARDTSVTDRQFYFQVLMLTIAYAQANLPDSAIQSGRAAYNYYEKNTKPQPIFYAFLNSYLGQSYIKKGYHDLARIHFEKSYAEYLVNKDANKEVIYMEGMRLFETYMQLELFKDAKKLISQIEAQTKTTFGEQTLPYALAIRSLAQVNMYVGEMNEVIPLLQKAMPIIEKIEGKQSRNYTLILNYYGFYYSQMKDYSNAFYYYEQEKNIMKSKGDTLSADYIRVLNQIALAYKEVGRTRDALLSFDEAFVIAKKVLGLQADLTVGLILNLGATYADLRNYRAASDFALYAYNYYTRVYGKESPKALSCLNTLGISYDGLKKYDSSMYFNREAIRIMKKLYGDQYQGLTTVYANYGSNFFELKSYDSALVYYQKGYDLTIKRYPLFHPNVVNINMNMYAAYRGLQIWKKADSLLEISATRQKAYLLENSAGLSESEKEGFAETMRFIVFSALNNRLEAGAFLTTNAWVLDAILFYKGLLLESSKGLAASVKKTGNTALQQQFEKYQLLKKKIGQALLDANSAIDARVLEQWKNEANDLERALLRESAAFSGWQQRQQVSWTSLKSKLKSNEAAVEYVAYYKINEKKVGFNYYAAFVVKPNLPEPILVLLKNDSAFQLLTKKTSQQDILVKRLYRSTISGKNNSQANTDSLYSILWRPILPYLNNISTVYFSTDGLVNQLNLAAILQPNGKRLVESYQLVQLSSTRSLLQTTTTVSFNEVELWGGIDYATTQHATFSYLPGSLEEVQQIQKMNAGKAQVVTGLMAKEERFKQMDGKSPSVLHIATHGFFFPDPSSSSSPSSNRFISAKDPLLRSGLALSQANIGWDNKAIVGSKEDGIVTAYEISAMDLSKTKLVILSACETGLGDVQSGEGVYGLQRAFKLAGVEYLIMSLWQVPDQETQVFMELLYKKCLQGIPVAEAFRATQLSMSQQYEPYQWAAFVLVK